MDEVRAVSEQEEAPKSQRRPRPDVIGWKAIADYLGVDVDTAARYYKLEFDPLPVIKDRLGKVKAFSSALDAWLDRFDMPGHAFDQIQALRKKLREARRGSVRHERTEPRKRGFKKAV